MRKKLYIAILLLLNVIPVFKSISYAQQIKKKAVKVEFVKQNVEVNPGEIFHNVVNISNASDELIELTLFINTPRQWKVIGEATTELSIPARETIFLPVQVASSGASRGGVGYAIIAVINDSEGNMVVSENCLLKIPRNSQIEVNIKNQDRTFDLKSQKATFDLNIKNTGNTYQLINIKVEPGQSLYMANSDNPFVTETMSLEPKEDSTITYSVKLNDDINKELFINHNVNIFISSNDTSLKRNIWFNYLDWKYINKIKESDKPLVLEAIAENLFSNTKPAYRLRAYGNILLPKNQNIHFNAQHFTITNNTNQSLWNNTKFSVTYNYQNRSILRVGDLSSNYGQQMFGKGFGFTQNFRQHSLSGTLIKKFEYDEISSGALYEYRFKQPFTIGVGGALTRNETTGKESQIIYGKSSVFLKKLGKLNVNYGSSKSSFRVNNAVENFDGYGIHAGYSLSNNLFNLRSRFRYGSLMYTGTYRGQINIFSEISTALPNKQYLTAYFFKQNYEPVTITENGIFSGQFTGNETYKINYRKYIASNIQLFGGPVLKNNTTNSYSPEDELPFSVFTYRAVGGIGVFESYSVNSIMFTVIYGYNNIYNIPNNLNSEIILNSSQNLELRFNVQRKNWSLYSTFNKGPKSLPENFAYALTNFEAQSILLMPTYKKYIYENIAELIVRATYQNNITSKSSRTFVGARINLELKKGWSGFLENSLSLMTQTQSSGISLKTNVFTTNYFRIGIKKVFDFDQPRIKYIDLDAIFFRDLNGDNIHQTNEPGIPNVLTKVTKSKANDSIISEQKNFTSPELISQYEGRIAIRNLPEGEYLIEYIPTKGKASEMIKQKAKRHIQVNKDTTVFIPFTDLNKLYGQVIINKADIPLYEDPDIANIKIIAAGNDEIHSTITDKNGYFEFYIPVSDYYRISINDILYENYTLQQPYYVIKFNGYKEFELNFVYDEKERAVKFDEDFSDFEITESSENEKDSTDRTDPEEDIAFEDITQLHQTNIRGVIREETTLNPVHANVSIVNKETGYNIINAASSLRTGTYFMTFISSDDYILKVESEGYWTQKKELKVNKITSFDNLEEDMLLKPIVIGQALETTNLTFSENSAKLNIQAKAELENLLILLHENDDVSFEIIGHTDGREAINTDEAKLSKNRALAVSAFLTKAGIKKSRISQ
ncbi:MAG: OmpA family protein, partial [Bacteroidota bacterium]|nr:OmpA family protein [Bacteroidota bacterium]